MFRSRKSPVAPVAAVPSDGDLDLGALGRALWRKKLRLILPAFIIAAITFVAVDMMVPRYKSETRLLIEGRENVFLRPAAERGTERDSAAVDQEAMNSQVQLVLSREVARRVIERLRLSEKPEFDPALSAPGPVRQLLMLVGLSRDPLRMRAEERIFESYYQRLTAYQVDRSRVIAVEFVSVDPELAAAGANAVAAAYLEIAQEARHEQTRAASQWLLREIESMRARVAEAEAAVEDFRSSANLFVGPGNATLSSQQLGEVSSQITIARAQKADADVKAQLIRDMLRSGRPIETNDIINSELIRRLNEQRVTLRAQLAEQSSTLLDNHPRIKELRAQIADLERQIRLEAERLVRSLENDARIAGSRVEELSRNLEQLKRQATSTSGQDVQLRALEREAKAQRDLLESYLAKYREATARETLGPTAADARVISRAMVSNTPYFPRKLPMVLIAFLGTLVIGIAFATTGELLAVRTYPPVREAEHEFVEPAPSLDQQGRHDFLADASPERMAGALRAMASRAASADHSLTSVVETLRSDPSAAPRVAVVGLLDETPTAPAALAVARALAETSRAVAVHLIADPAQPAGGPGFAELLARRASFAQVIRRDVDSRAHVIGSGRSEAALGEVIGGARFGLTVQALERAYAHVVLDAGTAPDIANEELARLAPVIVLHAEPEQIAAAEAAQRSLLESGCRKVLILAALDADAGLRAAAA